MESFCLRSGMIHGITTTTTTICSKNVGADYVRTPTNPSKVGKSSSIYTRFSFKIPFQYLWQGGDRYQNQNQNKVVLLEKGISVNNVDVDDRDEKRDNSVNTVAATDVDCDDDENCGVCKIDDDEEEKNDEIKFDRYTFSRLLKKVSMAEAKLYAKFSYLGSLTYSISKIQPENLLRYYRLQFVTSSLEKKEALTKTGKRQARDAGDKVEEEVKLNEAMEEEKQKNIGDQISVTAAYQVAASAASFLYSQTKSILPFNSSDQETNDDLSNDIGSCSEVNIDLLNSEMASFMATTTDSLTAVVGAKEDVKQAVADDLNSVFSSPCEWFICDDDQTRTRFFVIQGSESLASWKANLLFEPVQFEGHDVLVHRGIYEAGRGIYEQMLPEVRAHLKSHGDRATLRFTGHSLGGSLALLLNLMFLIRGEVPISSLLPVIAYGAPYVMCGGDRLLRQLGLPNNHFQAVAMHRDIVPRAFSSLLSGHLIELIKAMNGKFRSHPCLNNQKFLFAPMGELLILQPDDKFSPHHHLLPPGNGLYLLTSPVSSVSDTNNNLIPSATKVFLNSPHPLEILSDRAAYGSEGTIIRDHDMSSYLKSIRSVIRQDLTRVRRAKKAYRRKIMQPLVISDGNNNSYNVVVGQAKGPGSNMGQRLFSFSGIIQTGRDSFKRFSRLFASHHMHLLVVLFPARLLILETFSIN